MEAPLLATFDLATLQVMRLNALQAYEQVVRTGRIVHITTRAGSKSYSPDQKGELAEWISSIQSAITALQCGRPARMAIYPGMGM